MQCHSYLKPDMQHTIAPKAPVGVCLLQSERKQWTARMQGLIFGENALFDAKALSLTVQNE